MSALQRDTKNTKKRRDVWVGIGEVVVKRVGYKYNGTWRILIICGRERVLPSVVAAPPPHLLAVTWQKGWPSRYLVGRLSLKARRRWTSVIDAASTSTQGRYSLKILH